MFIELIQKIAETKACLPIFMLGSGFVKAKHHEEVKNFGDDQTPGDNFPYAAMVR